VVFLEIARFLALEAARISRVKTFSRKKLFCPGKTDFRPKPNQNDQFFLCKNRKVLNKALIAYPTLLVFKIIRVFLLLAQLVQHRASNRRLHYLGLTPNAVVRGCVLGKTLNATFPIWSQAAAYLGGQPDKRRANRSVLWWSDMTDT